MSIAKKNLQSSLGTNYHGITQASFVFDQTSTISMCALKNFSKNDLETVLKFMKWNLPSHYCVSFKLDQNI